VARLERRLRSDDPVGTAHVLLSSIGIPVEPDPIAGMEPDVARELIGRVRWQPVNLLDAATVRALGVFDVILCRNVFIYFSERATRTVMANLTESLCPGGVLAVGISESLHRFSPALACEEHEGVFYYRKAAG